MCAKNPHPLPISFPCREMVQRIAQDGYLIVTWANWHYRDFVNTWISCVKDCGITGYIVGAMDDRLMKVSSEPNCKPGGP